MIIPSAIFFDVVPAGAVATILCTNEGLQGARAEWLLLRDYVTGFEFISLEDEPFGSLVWEDSPGSYAADMHTPIARIGPVTLSNRPQIQVRNTNDHDKQFEAWLR
jgi:hypothetical protein